MAGLDGIFAMLDQAEEDPAVVVAEEEALTLERAERAFELGNPAVEVGNDLVGPPLALNLLSQEDLALVCEAEHLNQAEPGDESNPLVAFMAAPVEQPAPADDPLVATDTSVFEMPPSSYLHKGQRHTLVFQGVAIRCAHCGMKLTDSVSIERGLGPTCSKKGYLEDPTNPDEMQAMIDLAEYPDLVDYLTRAYKPKGVRALMNGLVKICALNRKSPVHMACTDAIDSLGYKRLASLLRESVAVVEIKDCKEHPGNFHVWVKKSEWSWSWTRDLSALPGAFFSKALKGRIVPHGQKRDLWNLMLKHYSGFCATVPDKGMLDGKRTIRIQAGKV